MQRSSPTSVAGRVLGPQVVQQGFGRHGIILQGPPNLAAAQSDSLALTQKPLTSQPFRQTHHERSLHERRQAAAVAMIDIAALLNQQMDKMSVVVGRT